MYNDKPDKGKKKLTWAEYGESQLPIPATEGIKAYQETMKEKGMSDQQIKAWGTAIARGIIVGGTGAHIGNTPKK